MGEKCRHFSRKFKRDAMKYRFMREYRESYKIKRMYRVLKVSRSGYYAWERRQPSIRQRGDEELLRQIKEIRHASYPIQAVAGAFGFEKKQPL